MYEASRSYEAVNSGDCPFALEGTPNGTRKDTQPSGEADFRPDASNFFVAAEKILQVVDSRSRSHSEMFAYRSQSPESSVLEQYDVDSPPRHLSGAQSSRKHDSARGETYRGFIDNEADALILIEATIMNLLHAFSGTAVDMASLHVRSGSVFVVPESCRFAKRWVDGLQWSPSRAYGSFLLYRQVEKIRDKSATALIDENTKSIAGVAPAFAKNSLKTGTQIMSDNGLTKRCIAMKGSDGQMYRVIAYYAPSDVVNAQSDLKAIAKVFRRPSDDPELIHIMNGTMFNQSVEECRANHIHRKKNTKVKLRAGLSYGLRDSERTVTVTTPAFQPLSFISQGGPRHNNSCEEMEKLNNIVAKSFLGRFFKLEGNGGPERVGARFSTELSGGLTTAFTMLYIISTNAGIMTDSGATCGCQTDFGGNVTACLASPVYQACLSTIKNDFITGTAAITCIATLLVGILGNLPLGIAPGLGINAFFVYTVVGFHGSGQASYETAVAAVFIEGLLFVFMTLVGIRQFIVRLIPKSLKTATGAGIGLFLAFIALQSSEGIGLVVNDSATLVTIGGCPDSSKDSTGACLGDQMRSGTTWLGILGFCLMAILLTLKVRGAVLISILFISIVSWFRGTSVTYFPDTDAGNAAFDFFKQVVSVPKIQRVGLKMNFDLSNPQVWQALIFFLYVDLMDTTGTMFSMARFAGVMNEKTQDFEGSYGAFFADASSISIGSLFGLSPATAFIESGAGIAEGAKTGLAAVFTSFVFFIALFFTPIFASIPAWASGPALLIVGVLMAQGSMREINWDYLGDAVPAFVTIAIIPLTYSIADGILAGVFTYIAINCTVYVLEKATGGKIRPANKEAKEPWEPKGDILPSFLANAISKKPGKGADDAEAGPAVVVSETAKIARVAIPPPPSPHVTLRFLAAPINPADINAVQGTYPILPDMNFSTPEGAPFAVGGSEGVAEIVNVSSGCGHGLDWVRIGSRVVMKNAGFGTWRQFAHATPNDLIPINHSRVSDATAATLMVNPCTAYRMLKDFVQLNEDDVVIQNGANSAVGQSVIQIAKSRRIKTINLIRGTINNDKEPRPDLADLKSTLTCLGADLVLTEEEARSRDGLQRIAALGGGSIAPKLALNCVGGSSSTTLVRTLRAGGVMVTYGGMSKEPVTVPTSAFIFKGVHLQGFWMTRWNELAASDAEKIVERNSMIDDLCSLVSEGKLKEPHLEMVQIDSSEVCVLSNFALKKTNYRVQSLKTVKTTFAKAMGGGNSKKYLLKFN
ncbi:hypothetical protein HDU84_006727 [Entophlyctis sp. JEL0112]|nr:hypothetical protein HDU84_006727 [Entophlyctis sp. JEL0112]